VDAWLQDRPEVREWLLTQLTDWALEKQAEVLKEKIRKI
jgi:hypothetical protein